MNHDNFLLGCRLDALEMNAVLKRIEDLIDRQQPAQVVTLNPEMAFQAYHEPALQELINAAELVTADGIGIVWGARQLGIEVPQRITGIDLMEKMCAQSAQKGWLVYLLGAAPGVAEQAARQLRERFPGLTIAGIQHGYFAEAEEPAIVSDIVKAAPHILFVGLGAPRQEWWIDKNKKQLGVPVCMGVGGSMDVLSGQKSRAPGWVIKLNLEWLYRLTSEPSRFKRQLVLPRFAWLIINTRMKMLGRNNH